MVATIRVLSQSQLDACPKKSLLPAHYRLDGTCRCDERAAAQREVDLAITEMKESLEIHHQFQQAVRDAQTRLREC